MRPTIRNSLPEPSRELIEQLGKTITAIRGGRIDPTDVQCADLIEALEEFRDAAGE